MSKTLLLLITVDSKVLVKIRKREMVKGKNPSKTVQLETKILLTKSLIKNWDKFTDKEKKDIEKWWNTQYCSQN